jgi:2-phosphosulfolactate phosphatase
VAVALAGGAVVVPVASIGGARDMARAWGGRALLAGERGGVAIPGFAVGNSPTELTRCELNGKRLILTTSNGTRAVERCRAARGVRFGALVNATSVGHHLASQKADLAFVCAGRKSGIALEDVLAAGAIVAALRDVRPDLVLTDGIVIALELFLRRRSTLARTLEQTQSGRHLIGVGASADVRACSRLDALAVVPVLRRGVISDGASRPRNGR